MVVMPEQWRKKSCVKWYDRKRPHRHPSFRSAIVLPYIQRSHSLPSQPIKRQYRDSVPTLFVYGETLGHSTACVMKAPVTRNKHMTPLPLLSVSGDAAHQTDRSHYHTLHSFVSDCRSHPAKSSSSLNHTASCRSKCYAKSFRTQNDRDREASKYWYEQPAHVRKFKHHRRRRRRRARSERLVRRTQSKQKSERTEKKKHSKTRKKLQKARSLTGQRNIDHLKLMRMKKLLGSSVLDGLIEIFAVIDDNTDHELTQDEVVKFNLFLDPSSSEQSVRTDTRLLFELADTNDDGSITLEEWLEGWTLTVVKVGHTDYVTAFVGQYRRRKITKQQIVAAWQFTTRLLVRILRWRKRHSQPTDCI